MFNRKIFSFTLFLLIFIFNFFLTGYNGSFAEQAPITTTGERENKSTADEGLANEVKPGITEQGLTPDDYKQIIKKKFFNVNIDGTILYGLYNNVLTSFYLAQDFKRFSYQLNAGLVRSNDFGYQNSSYYEGEIGFTGIIDLIETWKLIPQLEVQNESHGMFRNTYFSREETDKVLVSLKNEYKPTPSRWDFNAGGGQYVHRLVSAQSSDVDKSDFYELNAEVGWEYIWSAANKFRLDAAVFYYNYSTAPYDVYLSTEFNWGFKLIEYLKIEPGVIYIWNYDGGHFPSGKINFSSSGIKYTSLELSYVYDLVPFKPEEVYFEKKFIDPDYHLRPGKAHHVNFKSSFDFKFSSEKAFYLKMLKFKTVFDFEDTSSFYNYYSLPENLLSAQSIHAMFLTLKSDLTFDFALSVTGFKLNFNYTYQKFYARRNITFRPDHTAGMLIGFTSKWVDLDWGNQYQSRRYVDPYNEDQLDWVIWGTFETRVKILETFSLFAKIDNLYDLSFSYREGYPEPGIIFLAGLKIVI
ncbi:MAG TPA: hypothetical protein PK859_02495 [Spirochaetota bacterium]|nr:hypothetical protein [Spirochaetota bacterium]HPR47929.1 hypothetical protein [Spirochaetota bacterium]